MSTKDNQDSIYNHHLVLNMATGGGPSSILKNEAGASLGLGASVRRFSTFSSSDEEEGHDLGHDRRDFKSGRAILRTRASVAAAQQQMQLSPKIPNTVTQGAGPIKNDSKLTLVVDGTRFVVAPSLFTRYPDTMLGRMFSSDFDFHPNAR